MDADWPADAAVDYPERYRHRLMRGIAGLRLPVARVQAQFKLSQDRLDADKASVIERLELGSERERAVAAWMRRLRGN